MNSRIDYQVAERAMNAFHAAPHGHARWRDYVQAALDEYTTRMEDDHNRGQPFPQRPTDRLTPGRKVGISPRRAAT